MRSFTRPSNLIRHIQLNKCISPTHYNDDVEHENNEYMQSSSSSSGDSQDMSHDKRIEDDSQETSSSDFNYHGGHESDTPPYSTVHDILSTPSLSSSNSMFSCAYQSSFSDNASTTSGEKEVHNDDSSQSSSLSSTSANYIYESEDIDFSEEEEDEDMMDNLPPPIDIVEARLLELMMKYSVYLWVHINLFWNGRSYL